MYHQPIPAFEGNAPFIYACFCTEDEDLAYPVLARMYNEGFRVWPAPVGSGPSDFRSSQRLSASSHVILFMSRAMSELMRRDGGKVAGALRSSCLRTVVLLDDVNPSNETYALSAPDRVVYNPMNDSPFWLYIYNSDHFEKCRGSWPAKKLKIGAPEFEDVSENSLGEEYELLSDIIRRGTPVRQTAEIAFSPVMQEMQAIQDHPVGAFAHRPLDSDVSEVVGMIDQHLEQTANQLSAAKQAPEHAPIPEPVPEPVPEPESIAEPPMSEPTAEPKADKVIEVTDTIPDPMPKPGISAESEPSDETEPVSPEAEAPVEVPAEVPTETPADIPVAAASADDEPMRTAGQSQVNVVVRMQPRRAKTKVVARRHTVAPQPTLHMSTPAAPLRSRISPPVAVEPVAAQTPLAPVEPVQPGSRRHRGRPVPDPTTVQTVEQLPTVPVAEQPAAEQTEEQQPTARKNRHAHNSLNLRKLIQLAKSTMSHLGSDEDEQQPVQEDEPEQQTDSAATASLCAAVSRFISAYGASTVTVIPKPALQQRQR